MTPQEIRTARKALGLTLAQAARLVGYEGAHAAQQFHRLETGERAIRDPQARLMQSYLEGYRPTDWPGKPAEVDDQDRDLAGEILDRLNSRDPVVALAIAERVARDLRAYVLE